MNIADLEDVNSPLCREALLTKCPICKSPVGSPCTNLVDGGPLKPRRVHLMRAETAA